jgi:radical SAM superfamily enzyme YgiQ (UPF0313 family)/protein-L-isoaspartate O-methyltransferase
VNIQTGKKPCVLLISPGIIKWTDMDFGLPHLVAIGGYLQQYEDVRVEILDLNYEGGDQQHLLNTLEELGPYLMIGLSCFSSYDYMRVMSLAGYIKKKYPDVPLVTGGYHASALPKDCVFEGSPFDAAVVGEGEVPMLEIVRTLMGGGELEKQIYGPDNIEDINELPPYKWELLKRYWPRANDIGGKFQIYLSRGCPYHCTFCMERAKTEYKWRAYSSERAVSELERLSKFTDLSGWVVNLADPLFGFRRKWRREVLSGIIEKKLFPRQYWTLTRSDDLGEVDVELLAKARFSIGIGLESGSPEMLKRMEKGNTPEKYLAAMERLARLSLKYRLNWASNIIVGHPGETHASMVETREYITHLFKVGRETCGWLSIDPFRLYPGAYVHEQMNSYSQQYGTRFYHPEWWKNWYNGPFRAEHIDPSETLSFEERVEFMFSSYAPLIDDIANRFAGQNRSVDRVFRRSIQGQQEQLSERGKQHLLQTAKRVRPTLKLVGTGDGNVVFEDRRKTAPLNFPLGLHVKDPWIRKRETAVRALLEQGVLRTDDLIEALLQAAPEAYMPEDWADAMLTGKVVATDSEAEFSGLLDLRTYAMGLEGMEPCTGDRVADLYAVHPYLGVLLSHLVGNPGSVTLLAPGGFLDIRKTRKLVRAFKNIKVSSGCAARGKGLDGIYDGLILPAVLPRVSPHLNRHLHDPGGKMIALVGPRFRPQDLICLTRDGEQWNERIVAKARAPILVGPGGWLKNSA